MFYFFFTNQRMNIPPEMTIQECVHYTIVSVHSLLQYIVSVAYTKFLYMDITIALKSSNEIQQTTSMQLYHMILQLYTFLTFKCITI